MVMMPILAKASRCCRPTATTSRLPASSDAAGDSNGDGVAQASFIVLVTPLCLVRAHNTKSTDISRIQSATDAHFMKTLVRHHRLGRHEHTWYQ